MRARTATFLVALGALVLWDFAGRPVTVPSLLAAALIVGGFFVLVVRHRRVRRAEARHRVFLALSEEGIDRLARRWEGLPPGSDPEVELASPSGIDHPYGADLQLFGRVSLEALAGTPTTALGRRTLARWLMAPAEAREVRVRQAAVRELAPELDRRFALAALGRVRERPSARRTEELLEWAEAPPWMPRRRLAAVAPWLLPALFWGLVSLQAVGAAGPLWAVPLLLQFVLHLRLAGRMREDFARAGVPATEVRRYAEQIRLVRTLPAESSRLAELVGRLGGLERPADERLRGLSRWIDFAGSHANSMYRILAPFFLLDFHVHGGLERWKARSGMELRGWLDALGEVEALAALATLAHDHPHWTFPDFHAEPRVVARSLGHPLLPPDRCVGNDVELGPPGTFLLVTGSNMSGKSTLLRALGANVVLASAGAPVCAAELRLPPLSLHTSIRVQDSLEEGVSLFMAELLSLVRIVEAARAGEAGERRVLYLVDEMLQGTNSAERRVAARTVLRHLLASGAVGAVTTHDLTLAAAPDLEARAVPVHFRETAVEAEDGPRLEFDYRLRPGLATTTSALKLLEIVGLGPADDA